MNQSPSNWFRWAAVVLGSLILCACNATPKVTTTQAISKTISAGGGPSPDHAHATLKDEVEVTGTTSSVQPASHLQPDQKKGGEKPQAALRPKAQGSNHAALHHPTNCRCITCNVPPQFRMWGGPDMRAKDEFIYDGGDEGLTVEVGKNGTIYGLRQEDTVAIFDTAREGLHVQPTNRVAIYAPRFAAVRQIAKSQGYERNTRAAGTQSPAVLMVEQDTQGQKTLLQPIPPISSSGLAAANVLRERNRDMIFENGQALMTMRNKLLPFEDFRIMRFGRFDNSQKARLAERINAAKIWTHEIALQVVVNKKTSSVSQGKTGAKGAHVFEMPPGKAQLRIVKVASKHNALPGDFVDFTIRFDNVGTDELRNVLIIDNLSSRLEYVAKSQQSTVKTTFASTVNDGESLVLKWMFDEPLPVKKGGLIKFRCRVR